MEVVGLLLYWDIGEFRRVIEVDSETSPIQQIREDPAVYREEF